MSAEIDRTSMIVRIGDEYIQALKKEDAEEMLNAFIRMKIIAIHRGQDSFVYEDL